MPERSVTVQHEIDGTTHEIEVEIPDSFIPLDEVNESYIPKSSLNARLARATKGRKTVEEILEDEETLARIAGEREDFFRERLKIEGDKPDVSKLQETWRATEVKPLAEENEGLRETVTRLQAKHREADVNAAAVELGVKKSQLTLLRPYYRDRTKWSEEYNGFFLVGEDGEFLYRPKQEEGKPPYMTIADDLEMKLRSGEYADWFDGKGRPGSDYRGGPPGGSGRGGVTFEQFKKMGDAERRKVYDADPEKWNEFMDAIEREGSSALFDSDQ